MCYQTELEEFNIEHNADTAIAHSGFILYADGALRVDAIGGIMYPPPFDSYNRAKSIAQYNQLAVSILEDEFNELKAAIEGNVAMMGLIDWDLRDDPKYIEDIAKLETLRDAVLYRRELLAEAETEVINHRPQGV